jgi:diacylglycerol kinase family enzyme
MVFQEAMPVPSADALERLAEAATPGRRAPIKRLLVIVNPFATTMSDRLRHLVVYALQARYDVHAIDTERRGHAIELCREAAGEGYDAVVAFGGDGTVNEAANGLAGSPTPLAVLPGGATNVFCRMLGVPNDVVGATERLLALADHWAPWRVDLPNLNGRGFTFSAGVGLDASVVERVDRHPERKARLGAWYYAESTIRTFLAHYVVNPPQLDVDVGGRRERGVSVFVQNGRPYTYFRDRPIEVAEDVALDSGDIAGAVLTRASPVDLPPVAWRALSRRARVGRHSRVHRFAGVGGLTVRSADGRGVPVQVDGDYLGEETEVRIGVTPGALAVVA